MGKLVKSLEGSKIFDSYKAGHDYLDEWMKSPGVNVQRTVYHGETLHDIMISMTTQPPETPLLIFFTGSANFTGNHAEDLLKKIESLETRLEQDLMGDANKLEMARTFILCFKHFRTVVRGCFGVRPLKEDYEDDIKIFISTYRSLGLKLSLKMHILDRHTSEFLKMFNEKHSLGHFSEQVILDILAYLVFCMLCFAMEYKKLLYLLHCICICQQIDTIHT